MGKQVYLTLFGPAKPRRRARPRGRSGRDSAAPGGQAHSALPACPRSSVPVRVRPTPGIPLPASWRTKPDRLEGVGVPAGGVEAGGLNPANVRSPLEWMEMDWARTEPLKTAGLW